MAQRVSNEAAAYRLLEHARWGGAPASCPHCGRSGRCYYLSPADGSSRSTRTGTSTQRRVWKCATCRRQFSVLVGTVLEGSRVGLLTWLRFVADIADRNQPPTTAARALRCGVSVGTARRMLHRLELCARSEPGLGEWLTKPDE